MLLRRNHRTAFCKYQQAPAVTPSVSLLRRTASEIGGELSCQFETNFENYTGDHLIETPVAGGGGSAGGRGGLGYGGGFGRVLM
jgi:hypothetical protein